MTFWNNLDSRERLLLTCAGALVVLLALWFLAVRPVMDAKAKAETAQATAIRDLEIVQTNLPKLGAATTKTGNQPFNRNAVIATAKRYKLGISRVQPENNGALKVWFDEANSNQLLRFMSDMNKKYAATISSVQMSRKNNGKVSATLTFKPLGA